MQTATTPATALPVAPKSGPQATIINLGVQLLRLQLAELLRAAVFTTAERATATLRIYANENATQLLLWVQNVTRVKEEREAAPTTPAPAVDTTGVPSAEEVEQEAATMWVEKNEEQESRDLVARALRNARADRAHRGGSSDVAGELNYASRCQDLRDDTGLSHSDLLSL